MLCKFTASQEFEYFTVLPRFLSEFEEYAFPSLHSRECDVFLRGKSRTSSCSTRISQIVPKVRFRNLRKLRDARTPRPDRKREREKGEGNFQRTSVVGGIRRSNYSRMPRVQFLLEIPTTLELTKNRRSLFTRGDTCSSDDDERKGIGEI